MSPWCPLSLRNPLILNLLWQQRQLWAFHGSKEGRAQEGTDRGQFWGAALDWPSLSQRALISQGAGRPDSGSLAPALRSKPDMCPGRPQSATSSTFIFWYWKKKKSLILGKSLMRSGHVRTVQNASTLYTNVNRGSRDNVCDPKFNGGRTIIRLDTLWSTSVVWYHMDEQ